MGGSPSAQNHAIAGVTKMSEIRKMVQFLDAVVDMFYEYSELFESLSYDVRSDLNPAIGYKDIDYAQISVDAPYEVRIYAYGPNAADTMTTIRRAIGGKWEKDADSNSFKLTGTYTGSHHSVRVRLIANRDLICKPRVIGQETVELPDYSKAPTKTVTRDVVEWDCPESLLSDGVPS